MDAVMRTRIASVLETDDRAQMAIHHPRWLHELLNYVEKLELSLDSDIDSSDSKKRQ